MKQLIILILILFAPVFTWAQNFAPLDSLLSGWINKGYYPGGAVCVMQGDKVLFEKCYKGYDENTQVYVASAGKWVAAAVIGAVVDRTSLGWDDTVEKWLPQFKGNDKGKIKLRQLLSHTSGVRPYLPEPRVDNYNSLDSSVREILPLPVVFKAGTKFEYGGLAMQIAGRMAEVASGMTFENLFQTYLCRPLGMNRSHFIPVNTDGGHAPMLGGGLCTTLHDYMLFLNMIYHRGQFRGKRILSEAKVAEMQKDQVGKAKVMQGEFVEKAWGLHHNGIYGLGEWRELVDKHDNAIQISSPGWAGAYPWLNLKTGIYGFFITHVRGGANKGTFSSFFSSPEIARTVTRIMNNK